MEPRPILLTLLAVGLTAGAVAGCGGSNSAAQPKEKPLSNYESVEAVVSVVQFAGAAGRHLKRELPKCQDGRYEKEAMFECQQKVMDKGSDGYLKSSREAIGLAKRVPRCAAALRRYGSFAAGWAQFSRVAVPRSKEEVVTYKQLAKAAQVNETAGQKQTAPLLKCIERLSK